MTRRISVITTVGMLLLLAFCPAFGQAPVGPEPGKITGLQVSPDARSIIVKSEGAVGRHSAFVIKNPFRLVVDFDSTALAKVPGRINVPGDRIKEIRLGHKDSRTRLVVDFGDRPVPAFKIDRGPGLIHIALGNGTMPSGAGMRVKPKSPSKPPSRTVLQERPAPRTSAAAIGEGLAVKSAGVKDKLVFLELTDRKNPRSSYRLVIDLDPSVMLVKNATISDAKGNVKRFDLVADNSQSAGASPQELQGIRGPRRSVEPAGPDKESKPKFKWGMPAVERKQPAEARATDSGPFKLERFRLEAKKSDREG
jgi:hypothetical protein